MSYLNILVTVTTTQTLQYRLVGPSDTQPTPADGFTIDPEPIQISGVDGKFWLEYKLT